MSKDVSKIEELLTRGVVNIIPNKKLLEKIFLSNTKLNVYLGIDPTSTKIHLGHTVPLRKIQALAELGHNATFLIGDFTALIGDASDKQSERPILAEKQIKENFKTYKKQAEKIIDFSKIKIRHNSDWLQKLTFEDIVKLAQNFSVGDFVNRELIKNRLTSGKRVRLDETLYPVMQGYDSYYMDTDLQIGGPDQTFNMQAGRILQKNLRKKESFVLVTAYLEGTDGRKMSKSWGNAIWIEDSPDEMYGKVMSLRDDLIINYLTLATNIPLSQINEEKRALAAGKNPMVVKRKLAFAIVKELHDDKKAQAAQKHFEKTFQKKEPSYDKKVELKDNLLNTVAQVVKSKSDAKRKIAQGAVDVNEKTETNPKLKIKVGDKIKVGSRTFIKIVKP